MRKEKQKIWEKLKDLKRRLESNRGMERIKEGRFFRAANESPASLAAFRARMKKQKPPLRGAPLPHGGQPSRTGKYTHAPG